MMKKIILTLFSATLFLSLQTLKTKEYSNSEAERLLTIANATTPALVHMEGENPQLFSTILIYDVPNPEIIDQYIPESIKKIIHQHAYVPTEYKLRISSSINSEKNQQDEFDALAAPWSILFHAWANINQRNQKQIQWGIFDIIKKRADEFNPTGYQEGSLPDHSFAPNMLHKEQLKINATGTHYKTALPLGKNRVFMNFWTVAHLHNEKHNENKLLIINEFIIREPSFKTRKNRIAQGVFYPDLIQSSDLEITSILQELINRFRDYTLTLESKESKPYQPQEPFSDDLKNALKKISISAQNHDELQTLENYIDSLEHIKETIKIKPLTPENIILLAELYAPLSENEAEIKKRLSQAHAISQEQQKKIIDLAKKFHTAQIQNIENHIEALETKKNFKEDQVTRFGSIYGAIHPRYQHYAEKYHIDYKNGKKTTSETEIAPQDNALNQTLEMLYAYATESTSEEDFLQKCATLDIDTTITQSSEYKNAHLSARKQFILNDIKTIKETIQLLQNSSTNKEQITRLNTLTENLNNLEKTIQKITSYKQENQLDDNIKNDLNRITEQLDLLSKERTKKEGGKDAINESNSYDIIIKNLNTISGKVASYEKFIEEFQSLTVPAKFKRDLGYQEAYIKAIKRVIKKETAKLHEKAKQAKKTKINDSITDLEKRLNKMTFNGINEIIEKMYELKDILE